MSITEVFGGKLTASVLFDKIVLSQVLSLLPFTITFKICL